MLARRRRRLLVVAVTLVLAVAAATATPAVATRAKAAAVLAESVGLAVPRPFAPATTRRPADLDGVHGELYSPAGPAPAIVLVPGAAALGLADPRVQAVATALARAGRSVFVPELELYGARLQVEDLDRLARATLALARRPEAPGPVVLLGFSFGGALALLAAADPRTRESVRLVATFGSYVDLVGVVQAATTGVSLVVDRREPWRADARAAELIRSLAPELVEPGHRGALRAALQGSLPPAELPGDARAAYDLVTNTDPTRSYPLAARLGPAGRALLARFSPASVAGDIQARIVAVHSRDDPLVPYGELVRLEQVLPRARTGTVSSFRHVDLSSDGPLATRARDLGTTWSFATALLGAQEDLW